jgi:hypothetical protein
MSIDERAKLGLIANANRELFQAIENNDVGRVFGCLRRGASANARDDLGRTPLFFAARATKDHDIAELLLDEGADVRARSVCGLTPLHIAAAVGDETRIGLFLDRGAKIDARDDAGWTPLHCAATLGRVDEATFLVSRGSDVGIRDHHGRTPLDLARTPQEPLSEERWAALQQVLGGFVNMRIVGVRLDSLLLEVENVHPRYPDAECEARERGTLTVPAALLHDVPARGELIPYRKGLVPLLDKAWGQAMRETIENERRRDLGFEPVR